MTASETRKIGGILLAAGSSSRMGEPKQLLTIDGKTFLRRAVEAMKGSVCDPVIVVLAPGMKEAAHEMENESGVESRFNPEWHLGMSSSIKVGLQELLSMSPNVDAVVITLCDQPFIDARSIDRLAVAFFESRKHIVAAKYDEVVGVPALFSRDMFEALLKLEGDKGARDLIRDPEASIDTIEIKEAAIDIDTPDDMRRLEHPSN